VAAGIELILAIIPSLVGSKKTRIVEVERKKKCCSALQYHYLLGGFIISVYMLLSIFLNCKNKDTASGASASLEEPKLRYQEGISKDYFRMELQIAK
jgi:hypothetical protein